MNKISVKTSYKHLLLLIIILVINEPPLFYNYSIINSVYKILQLLLIMYMWMNAIVNKFYNVPTVLISLYSLWNILITFIFNIGDIFEITYRNMFVLLHVFCISHYVKNENSKFIDIYAKVLGYYSIINCILFTIKPNGWIYRAGEGVAQNYYFLGLDNQFARIILPGLILLFLTQSKRIKKQWIFIGSILFSDAYVIFQRMPGTLISCFFLMLLFFAFLNFHQMKAKIYVIAYFVVFIFCVVIQNINLEIINTLIVTILGKDLTFSGRTQIWNAAFKLIVTNPIVGYGSTASRNIVFGISAHNIILQIILESGFVGLFLFLLIFYKCIFANKYQNFSISVLIMGSFIIMISLMFEVYSLEYLFVILILIYKYKINNYQKLADCIIGDKDE